MLGERLNLKSVLFLTRSTKATIVLCVDIGFCILSVWISYYLRLGEFIQLSGKALIPVFSSIFLMATIFKLLGVYRAIFRYSGLFTFFSLFKAIFVYGLVFALIFTAIGVTEVPRTIGIIQPILLLLFVGSSRALARFCLGGHYYGSIGILKQPKVLIYGAGDTGRQLLQAISGSDQMKVVGFLDDDNSLHGHLLNGQVIYDPKDLPALNEALDINSVLLAMPKITRNRRNEILNHMQNLQVSVRTVPSVLDLVEGRISISDLRDLDIDDLLGRETIEPDEKLLRRNIIGKIVIVTGAGGSIGSELCRQIYDLGPKKLLLLDHGEFSLFQIHQELEGKKNNTILIPLLGSVQDKGRMDAILKTWQPDTLYHAAAYKHVPLVEHNLIEGVKNNVLGTLITAQAAIANNVENFVLISSDKAVRPTNIMGASKRLAEMILQALAEKNPHLKLSMVRFGNVLGSSGSVVPKFRQQIKDGGPITITHPEITRFFMTIPEASQLVIQAGAMARGGDVFVLDMGEPVKIMKLAERMIELSGLSVKNEQNPDGDIEIEITKLRPGEKLYEELLIGSNPDSTSHHRIMKARETFLNWDKLEDEIKTLIVALSANDLQLVRHLLVSLVAEYQPNKNIVDWVYKEQGQKEVAR